MEMLSLNPESYKNVSIESALNSRVSTGGWKGIERGGEVGSQPLTRDQVEFVFWCLSHTPQISKEPIVIEYDEKKFDRKTLTFDGEKIALEPKQYKSIKCPTIRIKWATTKKFREIAYSTDIENAYWLEWGMGQEMVQVAGAIAQVGVNLIGGTYVDLAPMKPNLTREPPQNYIKGNLPEPLRDGKNSAVECIEKWKHSKTFKQERISQSQLGQLLWAAYGCTPHQTNRFSRHGNIGFEGQGKTIPSASAVYSISIYVINQKGMFKYINWDEKEAAATHSLGKVRKGGQMRLGRYVDRVWAYTRKGDWFEEFQQTIPELPKASTYILVASNGRLHVGFSLMEAGYSVLHIILQAQALGLGSDIFVTNRDQMTKLQYVGGTFGLVDTPLAIVPVDLI